MREHEEPRSVANPEAGFFLVRLVRKGPFVPAEIRHTEMGWQAIINGEAQGAPHEDPTHARGVFRVWLGGKRIDAAEHDYRMARKSYAERHAPDLPEATPGRAVDMRRLPPLWSATES